MSLSFSRSLSQITDEPPELRLPLLEHIRPAWAVSFRAVAAADEAGGGCGGGGGGGGDGDGGGDGVFLYRCTKAAGGG